ncbi:MAG TPA: cytochrome C oxidase subunit IV family protein [Bacteroidia bacterium]|nr:cytochrome C oxidase subunit IV family protein [Bacteroidia bacterium]
MATTILNPRIQIGLEDSHGPVSFEPIHNSPDHDNVVFADATTDYHGHPHYGRVLVSLLLLLGVSLTAGYVFSPGIAIALIFATAAWKVTMVVRNFMHLKYEPLFIYIAIAAVFLIIYAFFFGVYPDITAVPLDVTYPR